MSRFTCSVCVSYVLALASLHIGEFCVRGDDDSASDPVVAVGGGRGKLLGRRLDIVGSKVDAFLGVRYAEPPVGERRFQIAKPVDGSWEGVQNATEFGSACWQTYTYIPENYTGHPWWTTRDERSEDCLFLNVWTPFPRPVDAAPVFVFIHGGSFHVGSTSTILYRGDTLAAVDNCVVVSMNYRLGPFGFAAFYTESEPGNLGLFDQILALRWVKANIANFGGDPGSVTLIGHSAGASSVGFHLLSPVNTKEKLYHRAILQSGAPNTPWAMTYKEDALRAVGQMAQMLKCPTWYEDGKSRTGHEAIVAETLSCLRQRKPEEFFKSDSTIPNAAVVDGNFLADNPIPLLDDMYSNPGEFGTVAPVPVLLGMVEEEATLNLPFNQFGTKYTLEKIRETYSTEYRRHIDVLFTSTGEQIKDAIDFHYRNWSDPENGTYLHRGMIDLWSDYCMYCPVREFAKYYSMNGNDVFAYRFNHRPTNSPYPEWMGMLHADELSFTLGRALHEEENLTDAEKVFSRSVMRYWSNFGRTGNPNGRTENGTGLQKWPKHTPANPVYMILNPNDTARDSATIGRFGRARECAFWSHLVPELADDEKIPVGYHPLFLDDLFVIVPESSPPVCSGHMSRYHPAFTVIFQMCCISLLHQIIL